jgi:hypothetical protein
MNVHRDDAGDPRAARTPLLLERLSAGTLLIVLAAVMWIVAAARGRWAPRLPAIEAEVICVMLLLSAALVLVCVLALWQTRRPHD